MIINQNRCIIGKVQRDLTQRDDFTKNLLIIFYSLLLFAHFGEKKQL